MCGIAGIFSRDRGRAPPIDQAELRRIHDAMLRRGPDGEGVWVSDDQRIGLAHRRLAIIDLSAAGAQPMSILNGRYWITFNGEIYNYRRLKKELEASGAAFHSESDTEVLLHLYARHGGAMTSRLRGMYAFAIWDSVERSLFIARDPFGIKPLYYSETKGTFRFASQVKALLAGGGVARSREPAGSVGFLIWGAVPEPYTLYRDIRALPAGSSMLIKESGCLEVQRHFDLPSELREAEANAGTTRDVQQTVNEAVRDSVRHHLVSDVPVGVFLSSGIDSSTVVAVASTEGSSRLHSLTLGFEEFRGSPADETRLASQVASQYGTAHQTRWMTKADFIGAHADILDTMDQPSTDGVNTFLISKAASEAGMKVAMSGIGGDELFGGYPSFRDIPLLVRRTAFVGRSGAGVRLRRVLAPFVRRVTSPKFASVLEFGGTYPGAYLLRRSLFLPWELPEILEPAEVADGLRTLDAFRELEASIEGVRNERAVVAALEMHWYLRNQLLRDADWAGMAHSLEIRTPLVDVDLFRKIAPLFFSPEPPTKTTLASVPSSLPPELKRRRKTGFAVPVREWAAQFAGARRGGRGLRGWALHVLPDCPTRRILALVTDAFGGKGGIALYNRDLITAIGGLPKTRQVMVAARLMSKVREEIPGNVTVIEEALGGKLAFAVATLRRLLFGPSVDLIVCGHINLLPLAMVAKWFTKCPVVLWIYGIDAWAPPRSALVRASIGKVDSIVSISAVTAKRFSSWSRIEMNHIAIVPNAIHLEWYGPGPKDARLVQKHGLAGKTVLMTMGRLVSAERYKGIDEVLNVLPRLVEADPRIVYMIVGEGSDQVRLEEKAARLGVRENVVFTGFVAETEKADYFRLADLYVMPSRGEGFGFVLLEAMACGVPVIASCADGTREAVRDGLLGQLVDPDVPEQLMKAIRDNVSVSKRDVPAGLAYFCFPAFKGRVEALVSAKGWL